MGETGCRMMWESRPAGRLAKDNGEDRGLELAEEEVVGVGGKGSDGGRLLVSLVTEGKNCVVLYGKMYVRMVEMEKKKKEKKRKRKRKRKRKKKRKKPKANEICGKAYVYTYVRMYVCTYVK